MNTEVCICIPKIKETVNKNVIRTIFSEYNFDLISPKIRDRNSVYQIKCLEELIRKNTTRCNNYEFTENILEQFIKSDVIILSTLWTKEDILSLENLSRYDGIQITHRQFCRHDYYPDHWKIIALTYVTVFDLTTVAMSQL